MNLLPNCEELEQAAQIVYANMAPTPQHSWPLLCEQLGFETWPKHENHTPSGAFKIRGGLVYFSKLIEREPDIKGVISATRGNHGQSVVYAARKYGIAATIVVPHGNSLPRAMLFAIQPKLSASYPAMRPPTRCPSPQQKKSKHRSPRNSPTAWPAGCRMRLRLTSSSRARIVSCKSATPMAPRR